MQALDMKGRLSSHVRTLLESRHRGHARRCGYHDAKRWENAIARTCAVMSDALHASSSTTTAKIVRSCSTLTHNDLRGGALHGLMPGKVDRHPLLVTGVSARLAVPVTRAQRCNG